MSHTLRILILIFVNIVRSELDLIWQDSLEKYSSHWFTTRSSSPQQINDDLICPSSTNCVQIKRNDAIMRKVHLDILHNLKAYDSFIILTTATSPCQVAYKYAGDSDYHMTEGRIPIDHSQTAQILQIELSASGSEDALCYFDDIGLFGNMPEDNTILFDNMEDIRLTKWIRSDNRSASALCDNHHMYKSIPNVHKYTDIHIKFDVHFARVSTEGSCQVWYKYDTEASDDWYILRDLHPTDIIRHIVTIHEDPHRKQSSTLFIKFAHFGTSCHSKGKACCHFSNVYVKGRTMVSDDPRLESRIASPEARADRVQNVIIIGDMGDATSVQGKVAEMMSSIAKAHDVEGIIALGDNIYEDGVEDEYDDLFDEVFEDVYTRSSIRDINWYFTTGNHDYRDNITGEVEYSRHSDRWNFPELYYTKSWRFGGVELMFIALDTYILCGSVTSSGTDDCRPPSRTKAEKHWDWLEDELRGSSADFMIVGGHTPIFSYASHGPVEQLIDRLKPLLEKYDVAANIFGHDHELQFIEIEGENMAYIGSGAGHDCRGKFGMKNNKYNPGSDALKYMDCDDGGFVRLAIDTDSRTMKAYYYLGNSNSVQYTSGTWCKAGDYSADDDCGSGGGGSSSGGGGSSGGGSSGGGGSSDGKCLDVSGFDGDLSDYNGEWQPTHTYYKKGDLYLLRFEGDWYLSDSKTIDWDTCWCVYCSNSNVQTCDEWGSYDGTHDGIEINAVSCGSGGGSGGGGSGGGKCVSVTGLESKFNDEWQADGTTNGRTMYRYDDYWLFSERDEGIDYWTISKRKGDSDGWSYGWCSASNIEGCSGEWDYGDGNGDRNCEFKLTNCNGFAAAEEPACLQDNDYLSTVCVFWRDESMNFELSHEECLADKALYYYEVSEDETYFLHFDNSSLMGEQWVISVNHTESFGGAYCRELDLLECVKGKWMDQEAMEADEYAAVSNGECVVKNKKDRMSTAVIVIGVAVLAVVIVIVIGFVYKYNATSRKFKKTKSMMVAEDEDSGDGLDRNEIWIEQEVEVDGDETNTQLNCN